MTLVKNDEFNVEQMKELIKLLSRKFDPIDISRQIRKDMNPLNA